MVEACLGVLVDHLRSYFSLHVLHSPLEKRILMPFSCCMGKNKIAAEVIHLFHLHGLRNRDDEYIYKVAPRVKYFQTNIWQLVIGPGIFG